MNAQNACEGYALDRRQASSHRYCTKPEARANPVGSGLPAIGPVVLEDAERQALMATLEAKHWHLTRVAEHLGISRNTLYRKLRKHGIARAD